MQAEDDNFWPKFFAEHPKYRPAPESKFLECVKLFGPPLLMIGLGFTGNPWLIMIAVLWALNY